MNTSGNPFIPFGAILGLALILAVLVGAWTAFAIKASEDTLSVTGSAKTDVDADSVRFSFSITRTAATADLPATYARLDQDLAATKAYLAESQVPEAEITVDPVMTNQVYDNNSSAPTRYMLTRTVTINSSRVDAIDALAQNLSQLASKGVVAQANSPEYFYTKLAELRVSLLSEALKDAKARADAIAKESGQHVGKLKSSASGVVQVLAPNSVDVSDYGQYDTSSMKKTVMVTVRATFAIR